MEYVVFQSKGKFQDPPVILVELLKETDQIWEIEGERWDCINSGIRFTTCYLMASGRWRLVYTHSSDLWMFGNEFEVSTIFVDLFESRKFTYFICRNDDSIRLFILFTRTRTENCNTKVKIGYLGVQVDFAKYNITDLWW